MRKFGTNQQIPTHFAFILILVLSFLVSWFTVSEGKKVSRELEDSQIFDIQKRSGGEIVVE